MSSDVGLTLGTKNAGCLVEVLLCVHRNLIPFIEGAGRGGGGRDRVEGSGTGWRGMENGGTGWRVCVEGGGTGWSGSGWWRGREVT